MFNEIGQKLGRIEGRFNKYLLTIGLLGKVRGIILALAVLFLMTLLVTPNLILPWYPEENEYSPRDIKSPINFYYEDKEATKKRIEEAVLRVLPVYDLDLKGLDPLLAELDGLFKKARELRQDKRRGTASKVRELKEGTEREISSESLTVLLTSSDISNIETGVREVLGHILSKGVTDTSEDKLARDAIFGLRLVKINPAGKTEEVIVTDLEEIYPVKNLKSMIPYLDWPILSLSAKNAAVEIVSQFATPNLKFNPEATMEAIEEAKRNVEPQRRGVDKGEMIVREGDRVDDLAAVKIAALKEILSRSNWHTILGFGILLLSFTVIIGVYLYKYQPRLLVAQPNSLFILGLMAIITIIIARIIILTPFSGYIIPLAAVSMLVTLLLNEELALFTTIFLALTVGILLGSRLEFILLFLGGGIAAIYAVSLARARGAIIKAGLITGLANSVIIIAYGLISFDSLPDIGGNALWGLGNGIICAVLTIGGLPFFENIFGLTTNFRLLELADPNNPLLKDLLIYAPGTHHHSLLVGNLAGQAADAVGANPLLARVASYYHDIGKVDRPDYYIENEPRGNSKHDDLRPTLSVSILRSHVKNGVELAKEKRLPGTIIDIIHQHHGTTLMTYFYHQAEEEAIEGIDEKDFRYLGPRPQTTEAAIVLLADAVEAAARTLVKPTAVRIEELVKRIIDEKFIDSQLDECDLTLKDLTKIAQSFIRILVAAYHPRIEYPEGEKIDEKGPGSQSQGEEDKDQTD